ncbi:collagen-binding domain-containing protein [Companilactobacillus kimchiensis]|uniref:Gram-positive cocci surface proteins LPxTG domain-containing protein n=1 Tax=Companilactobacillus kimchiensis TaxID=993692 RepID=A0A0R2LDY5_9LACO|nr:collagen-binding domain-containing protein [Companilactobacillus kimchiensis]KRN99856.1 hypothetical protein IV57_GL002188 [Companilactobacillus kimchiensis]
MLMKKGKEWALSCVAVSAAVLMGMSATTVHADTTTDGSTTTTNTSTVNNGLNAATQAATTVDSTTEQPVAQPAATQPQAASAATTTQSTAATQTVNDAIPDGGHVSDDYSNESTNQLGYASNFHIFANEAHLNTHTNGNVAVNNFYGNVNFGTNVHEGIVEKDISYIQHPHNLANSSFVTSGETRDNKVIFGSDNTIDISNPDRPNINTINLDHIRGQEIYQDKNGQYIDVENYLDGFLSQKSQNLSGTHAQIKVTNDEFPDKNQRVINLQQYEPNENNQIVIDLDSSVLSENTPLTIYGLSKDAGGTNIILNVDTQGQDPYTVNSQIKLIYNDGSVGNHVERPNKETEYFDDNHVLWNFYDSTASDKLYNGKVDIQRPFQGSVLAPKAEVDINANLDGNIAANKVYVNAESHRWDLQDDSNVETEFEKPITIPGEIPDEWIEDKDDENDGSNIEKPDEEETEEDIDPDTGELVDPSEPDKEEEDNTEEPGKGDEDNDTEEPGKGDEDNDTEEPGKGDEDNNTEEPNKGDEDEDDDVTTDGNTGNEGDTIIHGGSEGTNPESNNNLDEGLLSSAVGNNKDESQTSNSSSTNNGNTLPQTGATTGVLATIMGLIMLAFGTLLKVTRIKKED